MSNTIKKVLHERAFRLCMHAPNSAAHFMVPVELTGFYDVDAGQRICTIQVALHNTSSSGPANTQYAWVELADLVDAIDEQPIDYWELRRALLVKWMNDTRDWCGQCVSSRDRYARQSELSPYQRSVALDGGF